MDYLVRPGERSLMPASAFGWALGYLSTWATRPVGERVMASRSVYMLNRLLESGLIYCIYMLHIMVTESLGCDAYEGFDKPCHSKTSCMWGSHAEARGDRGMYVTTQAVESFVEEHYGDQIARLEKEKPEPVEASKLLILYRVSGQNLGETVGPGPLIMPVAETVVPAASAHSHAWQLRKVLRSGLRSLAGDPPCCMCR